MYIKQAWAMLRQNKLFSVLYIAGTGLAIAMTMTIFIAHYIKVAPIYPETNRANTWALTRVAVKKGANNVANAFSSYEMLRDWWRELKTPEAVTGVYFAFNAQDYVQPGEGKPEIKVKATYTDPAFFRVFHFAFLNGKPFTDADQASGLYSAVIGRDLAMQLFGTEDATGKTFSLNHTECRVAGVVRNASSLTPDSYGDLYLPYSTRIGYDAPLMRGFSDLLGSYMVYFKVKDAEQGAVLEAEVQERVRKYNTSQEEEEITVSGPFPSWQNAYTFGTDQPFDAWSLVKLWGGLVLIFLLVPALNLSGMISTRMESRLPEMGISKAFGAGRGLLLRQVLGENLLLTCLGGFFGLCLAWTVLVVGSDWIFGLFNPMGVMLTGTREATVHIDMLFSPWLFVAAFAVCLLLNVLSALIPAWRSLGKDIVYSLNQKK